MATAEVEGLAAQAVALGAALARRRADAAHIRAESATRAVALEAAKEELEELLRIGSGMEGGPVAVGRALNGQLDVTRQGVAAGRVELKELEAQIAALKLQIERPKDCGERPRNGPRTDHESSGSPGSLGNQLLRTLKAEAASPSAYRTDHARIWRDSAMPNVSLLDSRDANAGLHVTSGVVSKRLFDGFAGYNAVDLRDDSPPAPELHIMECGPVRCGTGEELEAVLPQYSSFGLFHAPSSSVVKVIAPAAAILKVRELADRSGKPADLTLSSTRPHTLHSSPSSPPPPKQRQTFQDLYGTVAPRLSEPSHVLGAEHFGQIIVEGVPVRFHECDLQLVYSTNLHGMSLSTLYNRVQSSSPTIIALRDTKGRVFGCYAAVPWKAHATRYYGTGESFVFSVLSDHTVDVYNWTRDRSNNFFQFTSGTFLAIGGGTGSHFALWIDEDLLMGTTSSCATFSSPPLTNSRDSVDEGPQEDGVEYQIVALEVWSLVPRGHLPALTEPEKPSLPH